MFTNKINIYHFKGTSEGWVQYNNVKKQNKPKQRKQCLADCSVQMPEANDQSHAQINQ